MNPRLPQVKSRALVKVTQRLGFNFRSQKGSHAVYVHPDGRKTTIPIHPSEVIGKGLLTKIINKDLQISKEEFLELIKS